MGGVAKGLEPEHKKSHQETCLLIQQATCKGKSLHPQREGQDFIGVLGQPPPPHEKAISEKEFLHPTPKSRCKHCLGLAA